MALLAQWPAGEAHAQPVPLTARVVVQGLSQPVAFVQDPSNPRVQYVVQQGGRVRVVVDGVLQPFDFLDLTGTIATGGERGLLGLAMPADYATSGRAYVNFTDVNGNTVIARFLRSNSMPLIADPGSRFDLSWSDGIRVDRPALRQPQRRHACASGPTASSTSDG